MALATTSSGLTDRMMRAARADRNVYEEVENDLNATSQALTVVVVAALASGIAGLVGAVITRDRNPLGGLIAGLVMALIWWAVWSGVVYFVGTRMFKGEATYGEVLRTIGFAQSPGVLNILGFIPILGGIIGFVVWIWTIWTGYVATKAALDLDTGNTIATIVIAVLVAAVIMWVILMILGGIGLGMAALPGVR